MFDWVIIHMNKHKMQYTTQFSLNFEFNCMGKAIVSSISYNHDADYEKKCEADKIE